MPEYICGVDLGGTKINTGIIDYNGNVLESIKVLTNAQEGAEAGINRICESILQVLKLTGLQIRDLKGIGIGSPGPLDTKKGIILYTSNLPGWGNIHIIDIIKEKLKIPVKIINDANAAALGEFLFGEGRGINNLLYVTISTGIGGGAVIGGKLYGGANSNAVEIGHMTIDINGPKCGCGNYGCFEALASGTAIARFAKNFIESGRDSQIKFLSGNEPIRAEHVFEAARNKDKLALEIIDREAFYLGVGIANLINLYNPQRIVLGGGVSNELEMFYEKMIDTIRKRALKSNVDICEIVKTKLGSDIGIIGAASQFIL
jgi:glucokinase